MPKIFYNGGYTIKQMAYARRIFGGGVRTRRDAALDVGYSRAIANSTKSKIEATAGFKNAMLVLAEESDNMAMAVMAEFKARGLKEFSNKDLVGALNAISGAWKTFTGEARKSKENDGNNKLRTLVLQQVENQIVNNNSPSKKEIEKVQPKVDLDF